MPKQRERLDYAAARLIVSRTQSSTWNCVIKLKFYIFFISIVTYQRS